MDHLESDQLVSAVFKPSNDLPHKSTVHPVGLKSES